MLKIGCWNIRGMNTVEKQAEIKQFVFGNQLDVLCITETKCINLTLKELRKVPFINGVLYIMLQILVLAGSGLLGIPSLLMSRL